MDDKARRKNKIWAGVLLIAGLAAILTITFLLVRSQGVLGFDGLRRAIAYRDLGSDLHADTFAYGGHKTNTYAGLGDGLIVASASGFEYYDRSGKSAVSAEFTMATPMAASAGDIGMVYDMGGVDVITFDEDGIIFEHQSENRIISAQINSGGWLALTTESPIAKGVVTVYSREGEGVYEWQSRSGYLLSAAVSPDSSSMAALTITGAGARVVFFDLDSEDEQGACEVEGELFFSIMYTSDNTVAIVSEKSVIYLDENGEQIASYDYEASYLQTVAFDGELGLYLKDAPTGSAGRLVLLDEVGQAKGEVSLDRQVVSFSMSGTYLGVLYRDGFEIYRDALRLYHEAESAQDAEAVLMRSDGTALLAGAYQAVVYVP